MPETAVAAVPQTATPASTPTSSGAPASPAATPATSAATPAAPASERPTDVKSLSAFLQKQDATADATTPQSPLVTDPAAAAIPPLTTAPVAGDPGSTDKGPIPFAVHHTALENARVKAVADYKQQHGWAEKFNPTQRDWMIDMATRMKDPVAFHRWFGEQLSAHPTYGQQFKTSTTPAAATPALPDVQIMNDKNEVVGTLSDFLKAEREHMQKLVQPALDDREQRIKADREATAQRELNAGADRVMGRLDKILRAEKATPEEKNAIYAKVNAEMARGLQAEDAALAVFERDILPSLEAKASEAVQQTNLRKAAGNTVSGTGAPTKSQIGPGSTPKQLAAFMREQDGVS